MKIVNLIEIERINIITGDDHAVETIRAPIMIAVKMVDATYRSIDCSIVHILCRNDNGIVLENTIIDSL